MSINRHLGLLAHTIQTQGLFGLITTFKSKGMFFIGKHIKIIKPYELEDHSEGQKINEKKPLILPYSGLTILVGPIPEEEDLHPIIVAVKYGKFATVKYLINTLHCPLPVTWFFYTRPDGCRESGSLFTLAADYNHIDLAIWLLNNTPLKNHYLPADINFFYEYKKYKDFRLWKTMFKHNVFEDINFAQRGTRSQLRQKNPLFVALQYGMTTIAEWLVKKHDFKLKIHSQTYNDNILSWALVHCEPESVYWLVDKMGFSLTEKVTISTSPILLACKKEKEDLDLVRWLIEEKKIDYAAQDADGLNALIYAVLNDNFEIVKYLVDQLGFSLQVTSKRYGISLTHYAVIADSKRILEWLQQKGLSFAKPDNFNATIVNYAYDEHPLSTDRNLMYFPDEIQSWLKEIEIFSHSWARQSVFQACETLPSKIYNNYKKIIPRIFLHVENTEELKQWISLINQIPATFIARDILYTNIILKFIEHQQSLPNQKRHDMIAPFCKLIQPARWLENLYEQQLITIEQFTDWVMLISKADWNYLIKKTSPALLAKKTLFYENIFIRLLDNTEAIIDKNKHHRVAWILSHLHCSSRWLEKLHGNESISFDTVIDISLLFISDKTLPKNIINESKLRLAEMLISNNLVLDEAQSPLNADIPILMEEEGLIKRALQGYYLIQDIITVDKENLQFINWIKVQFKNILWADRRLLSEKEKASLMQNENGNPIDDIRKKEIESLYHQYCRFKQKIFFDNSIYAPTSGLLFYATHGKTKSAVTLSKTAGVLFYSNHCKPKLADNVRYNGRSQKTAGLLFSNVSKPANLEANPHSPVTMGQSKL